MYAREVGGRTLTFGVSGMLYRDALVMYDRQTGTLWTQIDGRAIQGPLAGHTLEALASVHATWQEWRTMYPASQVLKKTGEFRTPYEAYNRSASKLGIMGRRNVDPRLPGKERILGIRADGAAKVFPLKSVRAARLVQDQVGPLPVVIAAIDSLPVTVYDRRIEGRVLTFALAGTSPPGLRDAETRTEWRLGDGQALEGPLAGQRLTRVVAYPAFWFGWRGFFPNSEIWKPTQP